MYTTNIRSIQPVSVEHFQTINQTKPSSLVSSKYQFIPTKQILNILADFGWFPTQVREARTQIEENQGYQKHAIQLFNHRLNDDLAVGDTLPQILLTNSHSGTAAFEFHLSLLEKVCLNGLIVEQATSERMRIHHRGQIEQLVSQIVQKALTNLPKVLQQAERFKQIKLDNEERLHFVQDAIELRFDGEKYAVNPSELLYARRSAQREPTLWNTYNVVQEALIRGGIRQQRRDGSRIRSREVTSIDENIRLNKALWTLAETTASRSGT
jgi:Domain of unknown function (DUF932)